MQACRSLMIHVYVNENETLNADIRSHTFTTSPIRQRTVKKRQVKVQDDSKQRK
jgi:hypothetical protein